MYVFLLSKGGTACVYAGQPLDTIKVKMQMFPHLYTSALKCGVETLRKDGIYRGLYAGTIPALSANIAGLSLALLFYLGEVFFFPFEFECADVDLLRELGAFYVVRSVPANGV